MRSAKDKISKKELKRTLYSDLRKKLINCEYAPGTVLNEIKLTEEYGVSRTPIREAINSLELQGYVKIMPKKGIYITDVTLDDALQIFQTRLEVEPLTLRMAYPYLEAEKLLSFRMKYQCNEISLDDACLLDMEMHLYIIDQCRNKYLIEMMHKLFDDNTRVIIFTRQNETKIHNAEKEHITILDSLIRHDDIDTSAKLMRNHIEACRIAAINYFTSTGFVSS